MGIGIIFVDRDRFFEARDCVAVPIERPQRTATVSPGADMAGRAPQSGLKGCKRLLGAIEIEQRGAAVVQRFDMVWRAREDRIEIRKRLGMTPKSRQCCAAIEKRIDL